MKKAEKKAVLSSEKTHSLQQKVLIGLLMTGTAYASPALMQLNEAQAAGQPAPVLEQMAAEQSQDTLKLAKASRYSKASKSSRYSRDSRKSRDSRNSRASRNSR
ncbi:hypothetical protein LJC19_07165 [Oxalobacter sp. OttesenSCG-928-P03]|nr:hypothetical protein [Oxalobacter sp. OttesenSCG-928-P03]